MSKTEEFRSVIETGYTFKGDSIVLGTSMLDGEALVSNQVKAPLKTFNRHGLIAGATGTGKTKTLQNIAERLSEKGVPVLLMDIKGDLSGLTQPGNPHPKIDERHEKIGTAWVAQGYPCELLTISEQEGARMRATISEFGPVLLSKILELNDTQEGVVSVVFKYCDDHGFPLLDIKDFRKTLQWISNEGKEDVEKNYGLVSSSSVGAIMRKLLTIEEQGADLFFGEKSFDIDDLMRTDRDGKGYISILRLDDIQSKPKLFSTFMLCLLAEIYESMPEQGDADKPELVIFIDEAHLIFDEASKALMSQIETIVKLIRSKGIGLFFVTQNPTDVPDAVLSQLGMKVQHALRAFTAKDRKAIKLTAENYPITEFYDTDDVLTKLGIGEAIITVLNEKGIPTPLVHTLLTAPSSRMDVINNKEKAAIISESKLVKKYSENIDRESAYEMLEERMEKLEKREEKEQKAATGKKRSSRRPEKSMFEKVTGSVTGRMIIREVTRGLLGVLGIKSSRR
ncbi:MAG: DNA helicase HerA-like ATPase [Bacteroidia bacterium]|jgi:DNA helicase HerA-like ATPase